MAIPNLVVVLLCVLGAGAVVVAVSAFGHHFFWKREPEDTPRDWNQISPEQGSYMRRVRDSNQMELVASVRAERMWARQSGTSGTPGYRDSRSGYEYAGSSVGRMTLHNQGARDVHSGYDSSASRYNGNHEKNGTWVDERTV